ncbi:glycosyltransferase [Floccifex sp.]|uniref:glycosyltransferase n=1 Tax=Floccifex sp. TaxID=2815810 RepID=UPI003EFC633F
MRVGLFTDAYYPDINGVVSSVATLKEALEQLGHTVYVISNHKGKSIDFSENILRLPGLELKKFYGYKLSSPISFKGYDYIKEMNLDVIHVQTEAGIGMFARGVAKTLHIPIVYTYHTMYEDYTHYLNPFDLELIDEGEKKIIRKLSKWWVNHSSAVIAPSMKTKKRLMGYGATSKIFVIPTGLDLSHFDCHQLNPEKLSSIRPSLGLNEDTPVVTFVGRIAKEKAIDIPIKAIKLCQNKDIHLVIVGKGTDLEYYKSLVNELDLNNRVHFTGMVNKEMVPYYYSPFDCFVSASTSETQGMTYIEALASGLCVFGRRDEVLSELIDEGTTGYYFDDEEELAGKWDAFFAQPKEIRQSVSQSCIEKTIPYNTEIFGKNVEEVYEYAISQYDQRYIVEKIVPSSDFFELIIYSEQDNESNKILVPMEDVVDLQIEDKSIMDRDLYENYCELQEVYKSYLIVKKYVLQHSCCTFEVKQYCQKKFDLCQEDINVILEMLHQHLLLDDRLYAIDKANYWQYKGKSMKEIERKFHSLHIDEEFIQESISKLDEQKEKENAILYAQKSLTYSSAQSKNLLQRTIIQKCMNAGFSFDDSLNAFQTLEIEDTYDEQSLVQAIKKANRLYSHFEDDIKYNKIKTYCIRKGFHISLIHEKLKELEND